jgi:hypothetical protein
LIYFELIFVQGERHESSFSFLYFACFFFCPPGYILRLVSAKKDGNTTPFEIILLDGQTRLQEFKVPTTHGKLFSILSVQNHFRNRTT